MTAVPRPGVAGTPHSGVPREPSLVLPVLPQVEASRELLPGLPVLPRFEVSRDPVVRPTGTPPKRGFPRNFLRSAGTNPKWVFPRTKRRPKMMSYLPNLVIPSSSMQRQPCITATTRGPIGFLVLTFMASTPMQSRIPFKTRRAKFAFLPLPTPPRVPRRGWARFLARG